jgi:RimJ/RimL family protein N-acetyltransferase
MYLKSGQTLARRKLRDGTEVILRAPRMEDLDDLLRFINALVKEDAMILMTKPIARSEEAAWLSNSLSEIETGKAVYVVAEADGRVVANCSINFKKGKESHVCGLGIAIDKGYRDRGLGTIMMDELIRQARRFGKKLVLLDVFEPNRRARHVYEKAGFKVVGRTPKQIRYKGRYIAAVHMSREL